MRLDFLGLAPLSHLLRELNRLFQLFAAVGSPTRLFFPGRLSSLPSPHLRGKVQFYERVLIHSFVLFYCILPLVLGSLEVQLDLLKRSCLREPSTNQGQSRPRHSAHLPIRVAVHCIHSGPFESPFFSWRPLLGGPGYISRGLGLNGLSSADCSAVDATFTLKAIHG